MEVVPSGFIGETGRMIIYILATVLGPMLAAQWFLPVIYKKIIMALKRKTKSKA